MIAHEWRARTAGPEATERYRRVFETEVLDELRAVAGFRGAYLLARPSGGATEIRTLTLFDGDDAVRAFAGDAPGRERVSAAARAALVDSDPDVRRFEVLTAVPPVS